MAKIRLTFTEEQIELIKRLRFTKINNDVYGIDVYSMWGGDSLYEDVAYALGFMDKAYVDTLEDFDGPKFPPDITKHIEELYDFFMKNLVNIEEILHQFVTEGIKPNITYWCKDNEHIWKIEEPKG